MYSRKFLELPLGFSNCYTQDKHPFLKTIFVLWKIFYVDSISFQKLQRELHELKEEVTKKDDEKRKREKEILENDKLHEEK